MFDTKSSLYFARKLDMLLSKCKMRWKMYAWCGWTIGKLQKNLQNCETYLASYVIQMEFLAYFTGTTFCGLHNHSRWLIENLFKICSIKLILYHVLNDIRQLGKELNQIWDDFLPDIIYVTYFFLIIN